MKKGFTMIELIFVIVILGILAAVAIPKLAATRDDARLAAVKTDIGTFMNAVPAWFQGQRDARIAEAASIDLAQWTKNGINEEYTLQIDGTNCVTIAVWDINASGDAVVATQGTVAGTNEISPTTGAWTERNATVISGVPVFRVIESAGAGASTGVCGTLWDTANGLGVTEQNITMAGQRVQW